MHQSSLARVLSQSTRDKVLHLKVMVLFAFTFSRTAFSRGRDSPLI